MITYWQILIKETKVESSRFVLISSTVICHFKLFLSFLFVFVSPPSLIGTFFFSQEVLEISQVSLEELVRRHCHLVVLLSLPPSLPLSLSIYLSIYQTIYLYIYLTLFLFLVYLILNVLG